MMITAIRIPAQVLARNSSASKIAANDPLTIFGDIGEFASNKLEPKASFFSRVSAMIENTMRISMKMYVQLRF